MSDKSKKQSQPQQNSQSLKSQTNNNLSTPSHISPRKDAAESSKGLQANNTGAKQQNQVIPPSMATSSAAASSAATVPVTSQISKAKSPNSQKENMQLTTPSFKPSNNAAAICSNTPSNLSILPNNEHLCSTSQNSMAVPIERSSTIMHVTQTNDDKKIHERLHAILICGPSGSGKSTLLKKLMSEFPNYFALSVSHTTRSPRANEVSGKDYHFVKRDVFEKMIRDNEFFEYTEFSANLYGTSKKALKDVVDAGRICIKDVDLNGVDTFKHSDINPLVICIKAPNIDVLRKRLKERKSETDDSIRKRIEKAKEEESIISKHKELFAKIIINDDLEVAYKELRQFMLPEIEKLKKHLPLKK